MNRLTIRSLCCGIFGLALAASSLAAGNAGIGNNVRNAWRAETLTGTIMMVEPNSGLVVVQTPDHVLFDMRVMRTTRIQSGDRKLTLPDLNADKNHSVSVTFVPTARGDVARVIHIMS